MKIVSAGLVWIAWIAIAAPGLGETVSQGLEFYVPAMQLPSRRASRVMALETGQPLEVALPPIATVKREDILGVRGMRMPVEVEPGAERYMPDPHSYRVVLELEGAAQRRLQAEIDAHCSPGMDIQIVSGSVIWSHVVVRGCNVPFEAGATFLRQSAAERFARQFTDQPVDFRAPTPVVAP